MEWNDLQLHVSRLAHLRATECPVLSCYLNVEGGESGYREYLRRRKQDLMSTHAASWGRALREPWERVERFLAGGVPGGAKGVAVFARGGASPVFVPLTFQVPLPNQVAAEPLPNLYQLAELKDTYERYIVVLLSERVSRILEVHLGALTREESAARPALRRRVGREWTREHYQQHRNGRRNRFLNEQVEVLGRLVAEGKYAHVILAGPNRMTAGFRRRLPRHLASRVVETIPASSRDRAADVVRATLRAFVEEEERESQAVAERLIRELRRNGLAVAGLEGSLRALEEKRADILVLAKAFDPPPAARGARKVNPKEEMVRLAERSGCAVEVVEHGDELLREFGGVGCLLRYRNPAEHVSRRQKQPRRNGAGGGKAKTMQANKPIEETVCSRCNLYTPAWRERCIHCGAKLPKRDERAA